jgi:hypothetical protein
MRIDVSGLELNAEGACGVVAGVAVVGGYAASAEHSVDDGVTSSRAPARSRAEEPRSETSDDDDDDDDRKPSVGIATPRTNDVLLGRGGE